MKLSGPATGRKLLPMGTAITAHDYASAVADALHRQFAGATAAIKRVASCSGSTPNAAKKWWAGENGPSGEHLIRLMSESDEVCAEVLRLAGRADLADLPALQRKLAEAKAALGEIDL